MRKGEWYLISDAKGAGSIGHVLKVDNMDNKISFEVFPRPAFQRLLIEDYPLAQFMLDRYSAVTYRAREITPMKARDARNLLKLLQRKLP